MAARSTPNLPRKRLDRSTVLASAVELADREGLDAVSMRSLSQLLGVVPMALYKHVVDKDDLITGMVDHVISEMSTTAGTFESDADSWKEKIRGSILAARQTTVAHPWLRRAIETRTVRTPAVLRHMETISSHFLNGGLSADLTHHAMHTLGNRIWGFSPELFNDSARASVARTAPAPNPADYPAIIAITADASARRPGASGCDEEFEFAFALDLILDAIERLHLDGWSSQVSSHR